MFELVLMIYAVANSQPAALSAMNPITYGIYGNLSDCQLAGRSVNATQIFGPGLGNSEVEAVCVPKPPVNGVVTPKYIVLTVIYAPPGADGGSGKSSVVYGAGSTTGSTISSSQSFKTANTLSFQAGVGLAGNGVTAGVSFGVSGSTTNNQSLELKKSANSMVSASGPAQDGIDHDYDEIWLLLNPAVNVSVSSSTAEWMLANPNSSSVVQWLTVGQLKGNQTISPGVVGYLHSAGITESDYPTILAQDPLASGSASLDPNRFILETSVPYEPPGTPSGSSSPVQTFNQSNSSSMTASQVATSSYMVGLSITQNGNFFSLVTDKLSDQTSWTWTNTNQWSNAGGTSETASVSIGGPAYGYPGPTFLQIYYDTLYKSFAFVLVAPGQPAVSGTLTTASGEPLGAAEVTLVDKGTSQRTVTDAKGEFRFYGAISDAATVRAVDVMPKVVGSPPASISLQKP